MVSQSPVLTGEKLDDLPIGIKVRIMRERRGLSQSDASTLIGMLQSNLAKYERGDKGIYKFKAEDIITLCAAWDFDFHFFTQKMLIGQADLREHPDLAFIEDKLNFLDDSVHAKIRALIEKELEATTN